MKLSEIKELAEKEIKRFDALDIQRLKTEAIKTNNPTLHARKYQLAEACLKLCELVEYCKTLCQTADNLLSEFNVEMPDDFVCMRDKLRELGLEIE